MDGSAPPGHAACRIGIDVGGTFTDFVLADPRSGGLTFFKEPSVPADPSRSVELGLPKLLERAGARAADVGLVVHGTTLALNAIIQRRGARVALVVSRGNRDVLEIARSRMPSSFDFTATKEEPLVPRDLVFEVAARIDHAGQALGEIDVAELDGIAAAVRKAGVTAVAVMLLHSYRHPAMERRLGEALRARLPGVPVTESAAIWPERREYERALVAVLNAYVQPLVDSYLDGLARRMRGIGITAPIYITASNGGTLSLEAARQRPIDTVLSGPASGVVAAARVAAESGVDALITFDMGGTSSDMAVSRGTEPEYTTHTSVGDFPLILPVVNVSAIGAGGGSKIWLDRQGLLKVGPDSAGADPGPVSYGRGGDTPTITDCYLTTGLIDPGRFLGGRMVLDAEAPRRLLAGIGGQLGFGAHAAEATAEAALTVATAKMATELYKAFARRGEDPRQHVLIAFGGAGPTHANLLAEEARLAAILVPLSPGTFCALGAILADVKRDYIQSLHLRLAGRDGRSDEIGRVYAGLEAEADAWWRAEGGGLGAPAFATTSDMRYAGQSFDLTVDLPAALRAGWARADILDAFHGAHEKLYGFRDADTPIHVTNLRLRVTAPLPPLALPRLAGKPAAPSGRRAVFHKGAWHDVAVHQRAGLGCGAIVDGPAVVEQEDTTTWILPAWRGTVDAVGNLMIRRVPT